MTTASMPAHSPAAILEHVREGEKQTFDQCYALNAQLIDALEGLLDTSNKNHTETEELRQRCAELEFENEQLNINIEQERDVSQGVLSWIKTNLNSDTFIKDARLESLTAHADPDTQTALNRITEMVTDDKAKSAQDIGTFLEALFQYHINLNKRYDEIKAHNAELAMGTEVRPLAVALKRACIVLQGAMKFIWDYVTECQHALENPNAVENARIDLQTQVVSVTAGYARVRFIIDRLWPKNMGNVPYNLAYYHRPGNSTLAPWFNELMSSVKNEIDQNPEIFDEWVKDIAKGTEVYMEMYQNTDFGILRQCAMCASR
ncbi:hypothetical protein P153DRAFT_435786 [Dothidotthia symphoricarpi CBS 119687]|uniref:Uncharacterized protein n=1 Tax=Dothidotthia symphoricarpi CBS 119687 TaxID=1392245 RepID=A0A6A5ZVV1_9PLEO|nr:uncharacterized protein P153DRAFT_435786 [Dothidotthia symphoricarpi CBS 119687]KAF2123720.1 hypothetical protein P153DRAFT_435786 [Dothidotthia symphoricarpi CBS 119687]